MALDQAAGERRPVTVDSSGPDDPAVAQLFSSAAGWMAEAMDASTSDNYGKVAALAPLAVEHLGKAVLWRKNPVLLVPLSREHEASLLSLATQPDLTSPKLRTISLAVLLDRLDKLLEGGLPIDEKRRTRMVAVRNGAMHVGLPAESRHILVDCVTICNVLLQHLGQDTRAFYGDHHEHALTLLDEKRTEIGHRVAAKVNKAHRRLRDLEERLGEELFKEFTERLEDRAADVLDPDGFGSGLGGVDAACPACGSRGRLIGYVHLDYEVDVDVEPLGNGRYEPYYYGGWVAEFSPQLFACNVCQLSLNSQEELAEAKLPASRHEIDLEDLGDDFDPVEFAESEYGIQD